MRHQIKAKMNFEACDIDKSKLPTNHQVIQYFLYLKKTGTSSIKENKNLSCYLQVVIKVITELWKNAKIPIVGKTAIRKLLISLLEKRSTSIKKPSMYVECEWNKLFRISQCKCGIEIN